jgi:hypothetical protein
VDDAGFFLEHTAEGYYYKQVQGQMAICERSYSDFVCWTPHGLHVERIQRGLTDFLCIAFFRKFCVQGIVKTKEVSGRSVLFLQEERVWHDGCLWHLASVSGSIFHV